MRLHPDAFDPEAREIIPVMGPTMTLVASELLRCVREMTDVQRAQLASLLEPHFSGPGPAFPQEDPADAAALMRMEDDGGAPLGIWLWPSSVEYNYLGQSSADANSQSPDTDGHAAVRGPVSIGTKILLHEDVFRWLRDGAPDPAYAIADRSGVVQSCEGPIVLAKFPNIAGESATFAVAYSNFDVVDDTSPQAGTKILLHEDAFLLLQDDVSDPLATIISPEGTIMCDLADDRVLARFPRRDGHLEPCSIAREDFDVINNNPREDGA